jgi:hypothetical protein
MDASLERMTREFDALMKHRREVLPNLTRDPPS